MRIVHVITRLILGGAQENTLLSCAGLAARGHDVRLITGNPAGSGGQDGELLPLARTGGYDVVIAPHLGRPVRPLADLWALLELTRQIQAFRPDVVHTHSSKAGILGRLAARRAKVPVVVHTIHGMSFNRTQRWQVRMLFRHLERRMARRTQMLIGVCEAMVRQALAAGVGTADQYHVVYSGMELEPWLAAGAARRAAGPGSADVCRVGTVARLFENKGHDDLLAMMQHLRDAGRLAGPFSPNRPALRFVWVGDGSARQRLQARLADAGLAQHVELLGLVPRERMPEVVAGLDLVVHTSRWEGLPRVLPQALLAGVPVVAWDLDGNPEVCQDGVTGRCVTAGNIPALARAVDELAGDAALRRRLADAGRDWCRPRFAAERMVEDLERLYAHARGASA